MARNADNDDELRDIARRQSDLLGARKSAREADAARAAASASALVAGRKAARDGSRAAGDADGRAASRSGVRPKARPDARRAGATRGGRDERSRSRVGSSRGGHVARGSRAQGGETLVAFIVRNAVYIVGVAAVVAVATILLMAVRSCVPTSTYDYDGELDFNYESPYDWNKLDAADGRYAYVDEGTSRSRTGIDVSENQGDIDWQAVKADGVEFAMIRLGYRGTTEGALYEDAFFRQNLAAAQAAGVDCGIYFFSQATSAKEARAEADFVLEALDGAELAYPVAFDFELGADGITVSRADGLGKDEMTQIADTFCKRVEKAGYQTMVYGNYYDLNLYHYDDLKKRKVWWAEYEVAEPSPHLDIVMWQYTSNGWVEGIQTPVDMNIDLSGALT